jgi:F0F1-type ATP synthase membrane subunit c/vacuolar-type H+-ATPase subunit K
MDPQKRLRIMWLAYLAAALIYAVLPWFAIAEHLDSAAPDTPPLVSGLRFGAIGAAVASFLVRRQTMTGLAAALQSGAASGPDLWTRLTSACIITWSVTETVAIVGLFIAFVTRNPYEVVPYVGATVFLLYMHRLAMWPVAEIERATGGAA